MRPLAVVISSLLLASPALEQRSTGGFKLGTRLNGCTGGELPSGVKLGWETHVFGRRPLNHRVLLHRVLALTAAARMRFQS